MNHASPRPHAGTPRRSDRLSPWLAALLTALLHLGLLLVALWSSPITVTTPQGSAAGGLQVVEVDYIGDTPPPAASAPSDRAPAASRLQTTPVVRADDALPPEAADVADALTLVQVPRREQRPMPPAPAASPRPPTPRRSRNRGQPPGMLPQDTAPVNAGPAQSPAIERGRRYDASSSEPNLEVGGYQVVYDLRSEARAHAWREQGMTELFLPLPGTRQYMVCPLETAIRRESGPCRLLDPDDPAMASIGDAREVLNMVQVYRRGELVWRGPGPYR